MAFDNLENLRHFVAQISAKIAFFTREQRLKKIENLRILKIYEFIKKLG